MISFLKTDKRKPDGKPYWDLINGDSSPHVHKSTQTEIIKAEKPTPRPTENEKNEANKVDTTTNEIVNAIKDLTYELHTMVMANMASSEAERSIVKARLLRNE